MAAATLPATASAALQCGNDAAGFARLGRGVQERGGHLRAASAHPCSTRLSPGVTYSQRDHPRRPRPEKLQALASTTSCRKRGGQPPSSPAARKHEGAATRPLFDADRAPLRRAGRPHHRHLGHGNRVRQASWASSTRFPPSRRSPTTAAAPPISPTSSMRPFNLVRPRRPEHRTARGAAHGEIGQTQFLPAERAVRYGADGDGDGHIDMVRSQVPTHSPRPPTSCAATAGAPVCWLPAGPGRTSARSRAGTPPAVYQQAIAYMGAQIDGQ